LPFSLPFSFKLHFLYKGNIDKFKEYLTKVEFENQEVTIKNESMFDNSLLGKSPQHLQITDEDFLHIYKYPSDLLAKEASKSFNRRTEKYNMVSHNLYLVESIFIIYEYQRSLGDFDKLLDEVIRGYDG
jgi:hypothetical protein